ncbi:ATPase V0 complex subunit E [Dacryopinax primogenitus]|uniref:ATPase V0 complex subunit E n=1 Tax=Dacryopinax primogenitus (strain DJM 731) TaxID=1858805 RepID=M5G883_DACPD|nr:ATPase V0 complex subunit E [Dacryopinax primogenitus]EJU04974.1 ATPase V0 complex subunit E [Dacryopinax primogenitus]
MSGWVVIIILAIAVAAGFVGWWLTPKGDQQTLIRTSILLTIACCYLMWAITYMAQMNPLIAPRRSDLRFDTAERRSL